MKTFQTQAAQGDMLITRIDALPRDAQRAEPTGGQHIVAHSETGHNHVVSSDGVDMYHAANDPFVLYLVVDKPAEVRHLRSFDTHESVGLNPGVYRINHQREYTPEGFRRALD